MAEYEFVLKFALPNNETNLDVVAGYLYEGGCDDALIGIGNPKRIALDFNREATSAENAINSAIEDVMKTIPEAQFIETTPDYVGLTDIANMATCSRQNMRKIMLSDVNFPIPSHAGNPELFHLAEVMEWMAKTNRMQMKDEINFESLFEVAKANLKTNLNHQSKRATALLKI